MTGNIPYYIVLEVLDINIYDGPNIKGRTLCYVKKNECPNVGPKRVIKFYLFNTLYTIKNNSIIIVVLLLQNFTLVVIFVHHASL